jgi:hypothetical protein
MSAETNPLGRGVTSGQTFSTIQGENTTKCKGSGSPTLDKNMNIKIKEKNVACLAFVLLLFSHLGSKTCT